MNAYTTRTQARIRPRDIEHILQTDIYLTGATLSAFERQRGWQAEAEVEGLLKQYGVRPKPATALVLVLRQSVGTMLVRTGARLAGTQTDVAPEPASVVGTLRTAV